MAAPSLPLHHFHSPFLFRAHLHRPLKPFSSSPSNPNPRSTRFSLLVSASSSPSSTTWEREEERWIREEQRWLREEQRWLREESRWRAERESLLNEIASLRLRIGAMENGREVEIGVEVRPVLVDKAEVKEMILDEIRVSESREDQGMKEEKREKEKEKEGRRTLRKGTEGDDVRAMQEALQRLGFYSGEEDIEYSSFSSGTERAVKTWQASLGSVEDGVMTLELLKKLFTEKNAGDYQLKKGVNGAAVASVTEIEKTVVKENKKNSEMEVSKQRVFLLGENRWEEPSRLINNNYNKPISSTINENSTATTTKCLSCRGEGRLMCTECDGTGEPNIEPQFLEWVGEGAKCPYCEGLGYTVCDVCEGKTC